MVDLFEQDVKTAGRQSSKGNQLKWENNGIWYKADYLGYEGLAEYVISRLLAKSTLSPIEYVSYDLEQIRYRSSVYNGVKSADFLEPGWQLITLERLFQQFYGQSLNASIWHLPDCSDRFRFVAKTIGSITGLKDFAAYLNKLFTVDALFLNEDRHTHNVAVLMNGKGEFRYCPIFDNGAGLLADTKTDYPLSADVYELINSVQAKTISTDFDEQLAASEADAGKNLRFFFTRKDVSEILKHAENYSEEERNRVEKVILDRMRKYEYLFTAD